MKQAQYELTVGLPATPRLRQVLQNRLRLVLLDRLRHHVKNIVHDRGTELEIVVRLNTLLRHRLGDTLRITALELTGEQVAEPALEQGHDAAHEEEPDAPAGSPEADTGTLADRTGVEPVVDQVLEVLRHAHLPHQLQFCELVKLVHEGEATYLVLVPVHTREGTNVSEDVLKSVGELEGVDIAQAELDVGVDDKLRQAQDLATQVEGVSET